MSPKKKHLIKSLTWRIISMTSTFFIGWYVTDDPMGGLKFSGWTVLFNTVLYYLHEMIWHNREKKRKEKEASEAVNNISRKNNLRPRRQDK